MAYPIKFSVSFKKHKYPGKLIALEGNEGSGKTTQAQLLVEKLNKTGKKAIYTKEPTDGEIGKFIRRILSGELKVPPVSLQYLFCADRAVHQIELEKYLKNGNIVVTDRYFWSAVAYGIADMKLTADYYMTAYSVLSFYNQFLSPDFTFYLDVPLNEAKKRISKSKKHSEIYDKDEKMQIIDKSYKKLISRFEKEFIVVNANKDIEALSEELVKLVNKKVK